MNKAQKITKDFYNKNALFWSQTKVNSFHHEAPFRFFVKYLKKGNTVLDMGCANGIHIPLFLGIGRKLKYEGIDISRSFLKIAQARYPQISFKEADILNKRTLPKKKYNGFWAAAILQHIPKDLWPEALDNIESITKKGAVGYITLPEKRPNPKRSWDQRHFTLLGKKEFKKIVEPRGWKIIKSGKLPSSRKKVIWNWFIVKLP